MIKATLDQILEKKVAPLPEFESVISAAILRDFLHQVNYEASSQKKFEQQALLCFALLSSLELRRTALSYLHDSDILNDAVRALRTELLPAKEESVLLRAVRARYVARQSGIVYLSRPSLWSHLATTVPKRFAVDSRKAFWWKFAHWPELALMNLREIQRIRSQENLESGDCF